MVDDPASFESIATCMRDSRLLARPPVRAERPPSGATVDPATGQVRHRIENHRIAWIVDGQRFDDAELLRARLAERLADPTEVRIEPATGRAGPPSLGIAPHPGTFYHDEETTRDLARAAGFRDIELGGR